MREYLIKAADGSGWIPIHRDQLAEVIVPQGFNAQQVEGWGDFRMEVDGAAVSFSGEDVGWQVSFEDANIDPEQADAVVEQVRRQITDASGTAAEVVLLSE